MATWIKKKTKLGVGSALKEYFEPNNNSTARKYITTGAISNNNPTDSTTNTDHLVNLASGLKSMSMAAAAVVEQAQARSSIAASLLKKIVPNVDPQRTDNSVFSEDDVSISQDELTTRSKNGLSEIEDADTRNEIAKGIESSIINSRHLFMPIPRADSSSNMQNRFTPDIEEARVDLKKTGGSVDNFYVSLLFNIHKDAYKKVEAVRIFRAVVKKPTFIRPLATLSSFGTSILSAMRGRKNEDESQNQIRLDINGVPNSTGLINYFDPYTGRRVSSDGTARIYSPPPPAGVNAVQSSMANNVPTALRHVDDSVLQNIKVLSNFQSNPIYGFSPSIRMRGVNIGQMINNGLRLGQKAQVDAQDSKSKNEFVIDSDNALNFQQIASISLQKLKRHRVGDLVEIEYNDETVAYGCGYKYFVVTVDKNMQQSPRSQIVSAVIEGVRVPERPDTVSTSVSQTQVSLAITSGDALVEKFEIHRREYTNDRLITTTANTVNSSDGFSASRTLRNIALNRFLLLGEAANGNKTGAQFTDKKVVPGRKYTYRVFAVDIFGNKSESPVQVDAFVPDLEQLYVKLAAPSILTEVDSKSPKAKISFQCDDPNIVRIRLERRDLTIGQESFSTPASPNRAIFGGRSLVNRRLLEGERIYDQDTNSAWDGHFIPEHGKLQKFVDSTVASDHIYQYRVWGEDVYGNRSSYSISQPMMVVRRSIVNEPVQTTAYLTSSNEIGGVFYSWMDSNIQFPAENLLGDQNDLAANSVRTVYQVQRLKLGESRWENFPLTTGTTLFDPIASFMPKPASDAAPTFRPSYLEQNQTYFYRVQAIQSGTFISNFSSPSLVFVSQPTLQPLNFKITTPSVTARPFFNMLNWDTHTKSGPVDHWEIERAEVNNVAASRLSVNNPQEFQNVVYRPFKKVYLESSRFSSKEADSRTTNYSSLIVGKHHLMDTQVDFGNSYFYRIRAVSPEGIVSPWSVKGIKVTSSSFEKKWMSVLTNNEKKELARMHEPMILFKGVRKLAKNSFSLTPEYARPDSVRSETRTDIEFSGNVRSQVK